jgi:hypothetical protein
VRGLVEAVQRLDLLQPLGVHALRAPVAQAPALGTAAHARTGLGFGHVLLHRAAGHKLDHHEGQQQHAQQGGQHEQDALEDVGQHGRAYFLSGAV